TGNEQELELIHQLWAEADRGRHWQWGAERLGWVGCDPPCLGTAKEMVGQQSQPTLQHGAGRTNDCSSQDGEEAGGNRNGFHQLEEKLFSGTSPQTDTSSSDMDEGSVIIIHPSRACS
uniref:Uncharacterized protein n=1 Tax=Geospiza parvula TaxID=87175 RepID=A0A8C3MF61_GEOPR